MVGMFRETVKGLHLPGEQLLFVCHQAFPVLDGCRFRSQTGVSRFNSRLFLSFQGLFTEFIPFFIEFPQYLSAYALGTWCGA